MPAGQVLLTALSAVAVLLALPAPGQGAVRMQHFALSTPAGRLIVTGPLVIGALWAVQPRLSGYRLVLALIVAGSAADLARRWRRRRSRRVVARRGTHALAACEGIAADVQAGLPPMVALRSVVGQWPEFAPVARAAEVGADVPAALRALGLLPGAEQARVMAAAWEVAHRSGAGLAPALELAARTMRDQQATATVVATEISAARATASILALLPFGVLLFGSGAGGDPWGFLLDSAPGLGCLALGLVLAHLGLAWLDHIADGVEV